MTISILAPGNSAGASADIPVAMGEAVSLGIYSAEAGILPREARFIVEQVTPGHPNFIGLLTNEERSMLVSGPGTYRLRRLAYTGTAFGGFKVIA